MTIEVSIDIPLNRYTTMGVGGLARFFTTVATYDQLTEALLYARQENIRYFILGKGSNTLFHDRGYNGLIILNKIDFFEEPAPGTFYVGGGYSFSLLGTQTSRKGYSGLEFASGIPGTVGGAVFMNAGANGRETCESLYSVDFITESGEKIHFLRSELEFSYRHSPFHTLPGAIAGATFTLTPSNEARSVQLDIISRRKATQPLKEHSSGCIFRNPNGGHSGALIDQCGLKGVHIGGAKVSEIHGNFIVNSADATTAEIFQLIEKIRVEVKEKTGYDLTLEVRAVPYDEETP